jgi:hypothetical protein
LLAGVEGLTRNEDQRELSRLEAESNRKYTLNVTQADYYIDEPLAISNNQGIFIGMIYEHTDVRNQSLFHQVYFTPIKVPTYIPVK